MVAIGNGTGCRETEELVAEIIAEGTLFSQNPEAAAAALEAAAKPSGMKEQADEPAADAREPSASARPPKQRRGGSARWRPDSASESFSARNCRRAISRVQRASPASTRAAKRRSMRQADARARRLRLEQRSVPRAGSSPPTVAETPSVPCRRSPAVRPIRRPGSGALSGWRAMRVGDDVPILPRLRPTSRGRSGRRAAPSDPTNRPARNHGRAAERGRSSVASAVERLRSRRASCGRSTRSRPCRRPIGCRQAIPRRRLAASPETKQADRRDKEPGPAVRERGCDRRRLLCVARAGAAGESPTRRDLARRKPRNTPQGPPPPQAPPRPHPADALLAQLAYVVVNEAGASVYSTSQVGREELPDSDATLRSGISIGRRLQDPLIRAGQDRAAEYRRRALPARHQSQASQGNARDGDFELRELRRRRLEHGQRSAAPARLGPQPVDRPPNRRLPQGTRPVLRARAVAAGRGGRSGDVHPGGRVSQDPGRRASLWIGPGFTRKATASPPGCSRHSATRPTSFETRNDWPSFAPSWPKSTPAHWRASLKPASSPCATSSTALRRPERDPRDDLPKPIFKKGILKIEDLAAGMELKGTVLNVVDFGAFVDIGLKDSGLVHISQLANRYVKSPHDMVSVGDVVTVWVMGVDHERKRVSLTMVKPGTERHRGPAVRRPPWRDPKARIAQGQAGQGRRGGGRNPAPDDLGPDRAAGRRSVGGRLALNRPVRRHDRDRPPEAAWRSALVRTTQARSSPTGLPRRTTDDGGAALDHRRAAAARAALFPGPMPARPPRLDRGPARPQPKSPPAPPCRSAASALQRGPRGQRPAANLRPAQTTLGSPHRRDPDDPLPMQPAPLPNRPHSAPTERSKHLLADQPRISSEPKPRR